MIRFEAIRKTHKGSPRMAVSDLTLHVREGEICVFVGPSGCGKTTILRMINRLDTQDSGRICVNGVATDELDVVTLRRGIGFMMQSAALFPHQTVAENIGAVPRLLGWSKHKIRQRVSELISLVGLQPEFLDRYPNQLSGGQQSRVALARALASDPPVVLMDEPFAALDPVIRERLQDELVALQRRLHKTIILVTHDMEEAIKIGDRIAIFEGEGKLVQFDTPHNILAHPASEFVKNFIGKDPLLKRLSLMKVSDLPVDEVSCEFKLLLDDKSNPLKWVSESDVAVPELTTVSSHDSLHHALVKILTAPIGVVVRVDEAGGYEGCLSIASLHSALNERRFGSAQ
ncbi:ABC transporter ATP-binding protein [Pseudomonas sp. MIACH]|uniref:ABC transporter ATP-binding protein n=1 Tax=Pseudomonas sp. MIACH TaxID=1078355 RepID=UPI00069D396F|nr:ABC transporter ATP-binding protein [Pseudomonas sp. MIACH]